MPRKTTKPAKPRETSIMSFRVTNEEKALLERAALFDGRSLSNYVRLSLKSSIAKTLGNKKGSAVACSEFCK